MLQRQIRFKIGVVYRTSKDQLNQVLKILEEAVTSQSEAILERAHFHAFGDFSMIFEIAYQVKHPEYQTYMDVQQAINFHIFEAFSHAGI